MRLEHSWALKLFVKLFLNEILIPVPRGVRAYVPRRISHYIAMNGVYTNYFGSPFPARTATALSLKACVEIDPSSRSKAKHGS